MEARSDMIDEVENQALINKREVGTPYSGCRGTQTPSGGRCALAGARGVLASFPFSSPDAAGGIRNVPE